MRLLLLFDRVLFDLNDFWQNIYEKKTIMKMKRENKLKFDDFEKEHILL